MKFLYVFLTMLILLALAVVPVIAENDGPVDHWGDDEIVRGDVNCDNKVDARDYMMLKRAVLRTYQLQENEARNADVNLDGSVDSRDYMILKRVVLRTYKF